MPVLCFAFHCSFTSYCTFCFISYSSAYSVCGVFPYLFPFFPFMKQIYMLSSSRKEAYPTYIPLCGWMPTWTTPRLLP
jgi:hypothetical protein